MEKKKLLLVTISVGMFLVVTIGASILVFTPKRPVSSLVSVSGTALVPSETKEDLLPVNPAAVDPADMVRNVDSFQSLQPADSSSYSGSGIPETSAPTPVVINVTKPSSSATTTRSTSGGSTAGTTTRTTTSQSSNSGSSAKAPVSSSSKTTSSKTTSSNGSSASSTTGRSGTASSSTAGSTAGTTAGSGAASPGAATSGAAASSKSGSSSSSSTSSTTGSAPASGKSDNSSSSTAARSTSTGSGGATVNRTPLYDTFWVQAGSFSTSTRADGVKETLASKGITSVIENRNLDGKMYYRVRVGPYTSQNEADYWLALIKTIDGFEESQVWMSQSRQ